MSPTLLYGTELFTLTPSLLTKLERCQQWFLKNISHVPKFSLRSLLFRLSSLNSVESQISIKHCFFGSPSQRKYGTSCQKFVSDKVSELFLS